MESGFSEFSYGFALTYEMVSMASGRLVGAPEFPSLLEEGKPGRGYDVRINFRGKPLFLQFKLSDYMVHKKAGEWDLFNDKYFRFWITAKRVSKQHSWLLNLEAKNYYVYYAAPAFYKIRSLNKAFLQRDIVGRSVFVRPSAIGRITDKGWHCVAFQYNSSIGYLCTEPIEIEIIPGSHILEYIAMIAHNGPMDVINDDYLNSMYSYMYDMVVGDIERDEHDQLSWLTQRPILDRLLLISRTFFGCDLLFIRNIEDV